MHGFSSVSILDMRCPCLQCTQHTLSRTQCCGCIAISFCLEHAHPRYIRFANPRKRQKKIDRPIGVHHPAIQRYVKAGGCLLSPSTNGITNEHSYTRTARAGSSGAFDNSAPIGLRQAWSSFTWPRRIASRGATVSVGGQHQERARHKKGSYKWDFLCIAFYMTEKTRPFNVSSGCACHRS